ncbi:MAG: metallophosphoesterase [Dehalococcoidia bacterium]|jgi:UDP-2,3-diacylglucosamine pyrophosphatase LpxH
MKIISASDFHVFNDKRLPEVHTFRDMVLDEKPDLLILNGDIFDPWKAIWPDIVQTISYHWLEDLTGRQRTIYINRNHDYNAPAYVLPSATRAAQYRSGRWLFMHGWEFSMDWSVFGPALFWLSVHWPGLMIPLNRIVIPAHPAKDGPHDKRQDWNMFVETGHDRARMYAQKDNVNLCIGHYHCPSAFDGLIVDDGDMEDSMSFAVIPDDSKDETELRHL